MRERRDGGHFNDRLRGKQKEEKRGTEWLPAPLSLSLSFSWGCTLSVSTVTPFTRVTHTHVGVRGVSSTNHWPAPSYEARKNTMIFPSDALTFPPVHGTCAYTYRVCTRTRVLQGDMKSGNRWHGRVLWWVFGLVLHGRNLIEDFYNSVLSIIQSFSVGHLAERQYGHSNRSRNEVRFESMKAHILCRRYLYSENSYSRKSLIYDDCPTGIFAFFFTCGRHRSWGHSRHVQSRERR